MALSILNYREGRPSLMAKQGGSLSEPSTVELEPADKLDSLNHEAVARPPTLIAV